MLGVGSVQNTGLVSKLFNSFLVASYVVTLSDTNADSLSIA